MGYVNPKEIHDHVVSDIIDLLKTSKMSTLANVYYYFDSKKYEICIQLTIDESGKDTIQSIRLYKKNFWQDYIYVSREYVRIDVKDLSNDQMEKISECFFPRKASFDKAAHRTKIDRINRFFRMPAS